MNFEVGDVVYASDAELSTVITGTYLAPYGVNHFTITVTHDPSSQYLLDKFYIFHKDRVFSTKEKALEPFIRDLERRLSMVQEILNND